MPVKGNQPALLEALRLWFEQPIRPPEADHRTCQQWDRAHGRVEYRTLSATTALNSYLDWPGVQQVLRAERTFIHLRSGKQTHEVRYAITSLSPQQADAPALLALWRSHWTIENRLHWPRDVLFAEDACKTHLRPKSRVLATCRNAALSVLRCFGYSSIQAARDYCSSHPSHALDLLSRSVCNWFT